MSTLIAAGIYIIPRIPLLPVSME